MNQHQYRSSKLLANRSAVLICGLAILTATFQLGRTASAQGPVNQRALAVKEFGGRAQGYVALQKKLESNLPRLTVTDEPGEIDGHKKALAEAIRAARPGAKQGDLFGPAAKIIKELVEQDAKRRSSRDVAAGTEEVPKHDPWVINGNYPANAPVATVPALLLTKLPQLPDGLEYRFMGRDLILRDTKANIVVDFINEATPAILKQKTKAANAS